MSFHSFLDFIQTLKTLFGPHPPRLHLFPLFLLDMSIPWGPCQAPTHSHLHLLCVPCTYPGIYILHLCILTLRDLSSRKLLEPSPAGTPSEPLLLATRSLPAGITPQTLCCSSVSSLPHSDLPRFQHLSCTRWAVLGEEPGAGESLGWLGRTPGPGLRFHWSCWGGDQTSSFLGRFCTQRIYFPVLKPCLGQ